MLLAKCNHVKISYVDSFIYLTARINYYSQAGRKKNYLMKSSSKILRKSIFINYNQRLLNYTSPPTIIGSGLSSVWVSKKKLRRG